MIQNMYHIFVLSILLFSHSTLTAQNDTTRTIQGIVIAGLEEPLIGATVQVKGTTNGTVTNINGEFSLEIPASSNVTLIISYTGTPYSIQTKKQKSFYRIDIFKPQPTQSLGLGIGMLSNENLWNGHIQRFQFTYQVYFNSEWSILFRPEYNLLNYQKEELRVGLLNQSIQINKNFNNLFALSLGPEIGYVIHKDMEQTLNSRWSFNTSLSLRGKINYFLRLELGFKLLDLIQKNDSISGLASILTLQYSLSN